MSIKLHMVTEIDERRGLVKSYWANIRKRVADVEPSFAALVDKLSPDKTFPIYLAYFPYGALKGDTESSFIPLPEGGYYRLSDPHAPADVIKNLGYGMHDSPLGLVLEKSFELFMDRKEERITIPKIIYRPGSFYALIKNLNRTHARSYSSNSIFSATSGARSTFLLPNIGAATHHSNLQREFHIQSPAPKQLYEHWNIFKEIAENTNYGWFSCMIYFSEKWVKNFNKTKPGFL